MYILKYNDGLAVITIVLNMFYNYEKIRVCLIILLFQVIARNTAAVETWFNLTVKQTVWTSQKSHVQNFTNQLKLTNVCKIGFFYNACTPMPIERTLKDRQVFLPSSVHLCVTHSGYVKAPLKKLITKIHMYEIR